MAVKTKTDKRGQMIAEDVLPLTPMEDAQKKVLTHFYHAAKGNISKTARSIGWSRPTTLKKLKLYNLHGLYKHEPWPERADT